MEIPQFKVNMSPLAGEEVTKTLQSGYIGEGTQVKKFEKAIADYLLVKDVVAVNSCTSALHLALTMLSPKTNKVLVPALTCFATTTAILQAHMEPLWCDIDADTCNISLKAVKKNISLAAFDAIIVVHYGGYPVDVQKLDKLLQKHEELYGFKPVVIEDCAHSLGAKSPWGMVGNGSFNNVCCFSFQAIKTLTTGDGGAIICNDPKRARKLRWFGMDRSIERKDQDISEAGFKYQMNDIAATIGLANIQNLEDKLLLQRNNVSYYMTALPDLAPRYHPLLISSAWMYPITVGDANGFDRAMKNRGIQTGLHHYRNDRYSCVKHLPKIDLPGVTAAEKSTSCIPCGWWVGEKEREYIIDSIKKGW